MILADWFSFITSWVRNFWSKLNLLVCKFWEHTGGAVIAFAVAIFYTLRNVVLFVVKEGAEAFDSFANGYSLIAAQVDVGIGHLATERATAAGAISDGIRPLLAYLSYCGAFDTLVAAVAWFLLAGTFIFSIKLALLVVNLIRGSGA